STAGNATITNNGSTFPYNPFTQPDGTFPPFPFWDGTDDPNNGVIGGGSGTWNLTTANWTNQSGNLNDFWTQGGDAIFTPIGGTVTVDDAVGGVIAVGSLRFMVTGYQIDATTGSSLQLSGPAVPIITDAGVTATISPPLTDEGFEKLGAGTLTLA